ncbi:hypothetical protein BJ993_004107 [Nocardioides aromaticivorans]|uniref:Uncharacterized protein n=1 Tax=Nocardioides aromaticivorans TaxID=200618 RepID=A0A7Z0CQP0_9ACTN|nr:hypothetical protein [Nocardioides aromaticivorans]NYI47027.1 hypothetical protein [Nocardioides aromaticivorans]
MLDEVISRRLRVVERLAWYADDGSPVNPDVGSVHMWFEGGRGAHFDGASDWTLEWSVSQSGDDRWMDPYRVDFHGRWVMRDSTHEVPFVGLAGSLLTSATPVFNEVNEVVGVTLTFEERAVRFCLWKGEIDTSPR